MKKLISLAVSVILVITMLAGCSGSAGTTTASTTQAAETTTAQAESTTEETTPVAETEQRKVTALFYSLEGEFFTMLDDLLRSGLEEKGYLYESQSSNFDIVAMVEQIENAVAKGTDAIWIWALDGNMVTDALKHAREEGVVVYSFIQDPGEGAADIVRGTDGVAAGKAIAEMTIDWANENFGEDAAEKSINTLILRVDDNDTERDASDSLQQNLEADGRFNILEAASTEASTVAAQATTENLFIKYADEGVDCICTVAGDTVIGICAYLASESCILDDPKAVCVSGTTMTAELADYMRNGYYDCSVVLGGDPVENIATQIEELDGLLNGTQEPGFSAVDIGKCTVDNIYMFGF